MKRFALLMCLSLAVFAGSLAASAATAEAGPWVYRPYRPFRPYVYRPYVYRPVVPVPVVRPYVVAPYSTYYAPPVVYGPPAVGYYGPGVSVGVGWY